MAMIVTVSADWSGPRFEMEIVVAAPPPGAPRSCYPTKCPPMRRSGAACKALITSASMSQGIEEGRLSV